MCFKQQKINYKPVSRILYSQGSGYHLSVPELANRNQSAYPPTFPVFNSGNEASRFIDWYTWHFSVQGLPSYTVTCIDRKLLPYVFTLTLRFAV